MSKFDEKLAALDIYCSGSCINPGVFDTEPSSYFTFVRMRRPAPPLEGPHVWVVFPGSVSGFPEIGVTVFGRDGKPVWQFAPGDEVHCADAFIVELDKRLPPLQPKRGAD